MRIAIASDHAGFELKEKVRAYLAGTRADVVDLGTSSSDSVDYPDYAAKVAVEVRDGKADRGILVCGTGIGMCISANKVHGIRAAQAWNPEIARMSRLHNDANVLCLSGRYLEPATAIEMVRIWLATPFEGGRHQRRVEEISVLESGAWDQAGKS